MIDVCLLVDIARQHLLGKEYPETIDEAKKVFGLCFDVLRLQEYYDTIHHEKIGGSETRVKQVFAEYLKQMHERNSGDSKLSKLFECTAHVKEGVVFSGSPEE